MNTLTCICSEDVRHLDCPIHKVDVLGHEVRSNDTGYLSVCLCDCHCIACDSTFKLTELVNGHKIEVYYRDEHGTKVPLTLQAGGIPETKTQ